ncbi:MAG: hypothetical protein IAE93_11975 [Ignavibacteria bacterium]|nr:hypothetical protein [Ignavibacteria bacterium]
MKNSILFIISAIFVLSACSDNSVDNTHNTATLLLYPQNDTIIYIDTTSIYAVFINFAFNSVKDAHQYRWLDVWMPSDTAFWGSDTLYTVSNPSSNTYGTFSLDKRYLGEHFWHINAYDINDNIIFTSESRHFSVVPF